MYNDIMIIINDGEYNLADLLHRIDVLYARGRLTDGEHEELAAKARENADQTVVYPDVKDRVTELEAWRLTVETRLKKLEDDTGEIVPDPEPDPSDEYPDWVQPTGAHNAYYKDDKMTYTDGNRYICVAPAGYGVTYGPDVLPDYWQKVE